MSKQLETIKDNRSIGHNFIKKEISKLKSVDEPRETKRNNLSKPQEGSSLVTSTELRAVHVRKAVDLLASGFDSFFLHKSFSAIFSPRWEIDFESKLIERSLSIRAAWNLVCIWFLFRGFNGNSRAYSFSEAEEWFTSNIKIPVPLLTSIINTDNLNLAYQELSKVSINQDFWDLFPYIIQAHGPGSRSSVLRDPTTKPTRIAKKRHGIFYTPSDVADYMASRTLSNYAGDIERSRCFDPACGTGVFLLSLCREMGKRLHSKKNFDRFEYINNNIFGADISAHAIDACTFVLLHYCFNNVMRRGLSPWSAWHAIRLNLANIDSLMLASVDLNSTQYKGSENNKRVEQKAKLLAENSWVVPKNNLLKSKNIHHARNMYSADPKMIEIGALFGEINDGFDILIGNPPYSYLGKRTDYGLLSHEYSCAVGKQCQPKDNSFLFFVEMMWRLTKNKQNSSAIVTPLSIAYNSGTQFKNCRSAISRNGGQWQFAFFDREPHALFGEEVKTRNAILFRVENGNTPVRGKPAIIETSDLQKWTSRTRKHLFQDICFTNIEQANITDRIPKVKGHLQAKVFATLKNSLHNFEYFCEKMGKCRLENVMHEKDPYLVYVGGTAYNFLNVFRKFSLDVKPEVNLSESSIHCISFKSETDAAAAFAILSSRFVFWLWHIQADGFHVPSWFVRSIPFHHKCFSKKQVRRLSQLGVQLWSKVQEHRFSSINGGKLTYTFRPLSCSEERDGIDSTLIDAMRIPFEFKLELGKFVQKIVVVDENDGKRKHLQNYFKGG